MRFGGLIAAIIFAAIAAVVVLRMSAKEEPVVTASAPMAAPQVKTVNIYVAAQGISIGSTITQDMVAIQPWPDHLVLDGFMRADGGANIVGMVARSAFQSQEPFLASKLANPNDPNFLAGSLPKGMRVITLQTNEIEGVGGFVFPGDRVDVLLTHQVQRLVSVSGSNPNTAPSLEAEPVTETVMNNALVVAVDQRASSANTTDKNGNISIPRSVSLMVSPLDAQRLRLGSQKGTLTLVLRSLQDKETTDPLITTRMSDVSKVSDAGGVSSDSVMIVRGIDPTESISVASAPATDAAGQQAASQATSVVRATNSSVAPTAAAPNNTPAAATPPPLPPVTTPQLPPPPSPMR